MKATTVTYVGGTSTRKNLFDMVFTILKISIHLVKQKEEGMDYLAAI
jgi:hypothetical protein